MLRSSRRTYALLSALIAGALCAFALPFFSAYADEQPAGQQETEATNQASEQDSATNQTEQSEQAEQASQDEDASAGTTATNDTGITPEDMRRAEEEVRAAEEAMRAEQQARSEEAAALRSEDETDAAEEERQAQAYAAALAVYESALANAEGAQAQLAQLPALEEELALHMQDFETAYATFSKLRDRIAPLEKKLKKQGQSRKFLLAQRQAKDKQCSEALYGLLLTNRELARTDGADIVSVLLGTCNATAAEAYDYLLQKIAASHAEAKQQAEDERSAIDERIARIEKRMKQTLDTIEKTEEQVREAERALHAVVDSGNEAAFAIETVCSEARQAGKDAAEPVLALDKSIEGVDELIGSAQAWDLSSNDLRVHAQNFVGTWYDALDAAAGLQNGISYGCGLDFALDKEAFIEKWGTVIDQFFLDYGAKAGARVPLYGYGKEMAKRAYEYKVDPRLCAAVSINESSGGRVCIRPHNAWGWGAADSDPYNLASEWPSWEVAIESWHRGMATSTTGLATASSLSRLSDIYCSTPIWAARAATHMAEMSRIASTLYAETA